MCLNSGWSATRADCFTTLLKFRFQCGCLRGKKLKLFHSSGSYCVMLHFFFSSWFGSSRCLFDELRTDASIVILISSYSPALDDQQFECNSPVNNSMNCSNFMLKVRERPRTGFACWFLISGTHLFVFETSGLRNKIQIWNVYIDEISWAVNRLNEFRFEK